MYFSKCSFYKIKDSKVDKKNLKEGIIVKKQDYLKRIGINREVGVGLNSLRLIQRQHLLTVPFENLDIHIYNQIKTDYDLLYKKIVYKKRGGICYELNWLLYTLLKDIGFNTKVLGGKVLEKNGTYLDHMLLLVEISSIKYLVDVGYGDNFLEPLVFEIDIVQRDKKGLFKVEKINDIYFELKKYSYEINDFKTEYIFKNEEKRIHDFKDRIEYFTNSQESTFKKNLFCSLEKEDGRISLKHDKLIFTQNGSKIAEKITTPIKYIYCLNEKFKINLNLNEQKNLEELWYKYI